MEVGKNEDPSHLMPHIRRMLVHQRRRRIAPKQLRYNEQANLLLAFESLLEDIVPAAVRHEIDDAAAVQ
jgi:hypothetical protein